MPGTRAANRGDGKIRTHILLITSQLLCQLSYIAECVVGAQTPRSRAVDVLPG